MRQMGRSIDKNRDRNIGERVKRRKCNVGSCHDSPRVEICEIEEWQNPVSDQQSENERKAWNFAPGVSEFASRISV